MCGLVTFKHVLVDLLSRAEGDIAIPGGTGHTSGRNADTQ